MTHEPAKSPARPEVDTSILAAARVIGTPNVAFILFEAVSADVDEPAEDGTGDNDESAEDS